MANYDQAQKPTKNYEGLYSNDEGDKGGETVWGITRNTDPEWEGWAVVDEYKNKPNFPENLRSSGIDAMVDAFDKKKYWVPVRGDEINDQLSANSIYDSSVNNGPEEAIILTQRSLGIPTTGIMDDDTLNHLNNKS